MNTTEMEVFASDPLNPQFGYTFRLTVNGSPTASVSLNANDALAIIKGAMQTVQKKAA